MKLITGLSCLVLLLAACKKDKSPEPAPPATGENVYIAGFSRNNNADGTFACYWKNGTQVVLTSTAAGTDASAEDIAVSGNDVYLVGGQRNPAGIYVAMYWKNGAATALTDGTRHAYATGVEVVGADVYIVYGEQTAAGKQQVKLWKNGTITNITDGTLNTTSSDLVVSGTDIYILGVETAAPRTIKYWKNGVPFTIPLARTTNANFYDMAVSGGDVYTCGNEYDPTSSFSNAVYFRNNSETNLTTAAPGAVAWGGIAVNGTDVYVGGLVNLPGLISVATVWKNGVPVTIGDGILNSNVRALAVKNNNLYVVYTENNSAFTANTIKLWKNGTTTAITNGTPSAAGVAIVVQ